MEVGELLEREQAITKSKVIRSFTLSRDDIVDLYNLLVLLSKQSMEYQAEKLVNDTDLDWERNAELLTKVISSYPVHITIQDTKLGTIYGSDHDVFSREVFPDDIQNIFFSTRTEYKKLSNGTDPIRYIEVFLDFDRPLAIDFINIPSHPTKNGSIYDVNGTGLTWVNGAYSRLETFFDSKKRKIEWFHRQGTFDLALWFIGIPLIFWGIYRVSGFLGMNFWEDFFRIGVYVFLFFIFANVFKAIFTYAKWVFPLVEYTDTNHPARLHKNFLIAIMVGISVSTIIDVLFLYFP